MEMTTTLPGRSSRTLHEGLGSMKIMQLVSGIGINGAIKHCYDLTVQLAERGYPVVLAHKRDAWIAQQPFPANVEFLETTLRRNRSELPRMAAEARLRQVDVIHSHLSSAHFFGVLMARLFKLRCVATSHMTFLQPHWWWNDRVICPSQATANFQRRINWVPRRRIDVVHYSIDCDRFQPRMASSHTREDLGIGKDAFVITVLGQVCKRKAQHVLIEALPHLLAAGIPAHVLLVGSSDRDYESQLSQTIAKHSLQSNVSLLGLRSDVSDLLAASDCCCLSSNREVTPVSLLEAMSMGLPAVSTRVGGVAECIRDGVDGYVVRPRQPKELADGLLKIASDPVLRRQMGQNARQQVLNHFSPDACIPRIVECYRKACGLPE